MSKQVPWNKVILETFISDAMLTKDEEWLMRTRVAGWSISKQAMYMNVSESTVNRMISELKRKYDNSAKYNTLLPPRKSSKEEIYMDTH